MPKETESTLQKVLLARWFLFLLLGLVVVIAIGYARAYYEDFQVRQQIAALEKEVQALQKKKFTTLELLERANTDSFLEEKAKTELNLKKPDEKVLIIPEISNSLIEEEVVPPSSPVDEQNLSNPRKWWYYFTGQFTGQTYPLKPSN